MQIKTIIIISAFLVLSGCSWLGINTELPEDKRVLTPIQQAEDKLFLAVGAFDVAITALLPYEDLPRCSTVAQPDEGPPVLCSNDSIIAEMRKAVRATRAAIGETQTLLATPGIEESVAVSAVAAVKAGVEAVNIYVDIYGDKE